MLHECESLFCDRFAEHLWSVGGDSKVRLCTLHNDAMEDGLATLENLGGPPWQAMDSIGLERLESITPEPETTEEWERVGPSEGDYVIVNDRWGLQARVHEGSATAWVSLDRDEPDGWKFTIAEDMEENGYWPNVWTCSDHGNYSLFDMKGHDDHESVDWQLWRARLDVEEDEAELMNLMDDLLYEDENMDHAAMVKELCDIVDTEAKPEAVEIAIHEWIAKVA